MTLTQGDLDQFTGTQVWYRHDLMKRITYTEGVKFLADKAGAYWLIDNIAAHQLDIKISVEPFQVWTLKKDPNGVGASLSVTDGNGGDIHEERIGFTDFPLPEVTLWFTDDVILLPTEY